MENRLSRFRSIENIDPRVKDFLYHLSQRRNVYVMDDNPPQDPTVDETIAIMQRLNVNVWSCYAKDLTEEEVNPVVVEDGEAVFDNIHLFDSAEMVVLRQCEDLVGKDQLCDALLAAFARRNPHDAPILKHAVLVLTFRGKDMSEALYQQHSFSDLEDRIRGMFVAAYF